MATTLELVLLYLLAAVLGVVACRSLKLPPMLGYLVVGVLIGPNALALAQMVYFIFLQLPFTGAEDGLQQIPRGTLLGLVLVVLASGHGVLRLAALVADERDVDRRDALQHLVRADAVEGGELREEGDDDLHGMTPVSGGRVSSGDVKAAAVGVGR